MLFLLVLVSIGTGIAIGRDSYFGAVAFGVVALIALVDFYLHFRRDRSAAQRWHAYRRAELEKLAKEYRDRAWEDYQKSLGSKGPDGQPVDVRGFDEEAKRQAEQELLSRLGPPY